MSTLNLALVATPQAAELQPTEPRSTWRYSSFAVQLGRSRLRCRRPASTAGLGIANAGKPRLVGADVTNRQAAGYVGHDRVDRVADPAARGSNPAVASFQPAQARLLKLPRILLQSTLPSRPNTQGPPGICQL